MKQIMIVLALGAAFAACGVAGVDIDADDQPLAATDEIIGGVSYSGLPAIGALFVNGAPYCTGTLVGPRKVLTAAHCVRGVTAASMEFRIGPNAFQPRYVVGVAKLKAHPHFNPTTITNDIAYVTLKTDAPATPMTLLAGMDTTWVGTPLLFVGYGVTNGHTQTGVGKKRAVTIPITEVGDTQFRYEAPGKNSCNGDSGGPALFRDPTAGYLIAGVTSYGDVGCTVYGVDTRVDAYVSFVGAAAAGPSDPCRGETFGGRCKNGTLIWCENHEVMTLDCNADGATCGWDPSGGYYNCF